MSDHLRAVLQALFVTFLWSTSWVLIKIGLGDIPALTFAGLRYCIAFLVLLPYARKSLRGISSSLWRRLIVLGLLFYTITQGAQFVGLSYLPAISVTMLISFSAVVTMLIGAVMLGERPSPLQIGGVLLYVVGAVVYFSPAALPQGEIIGLIVVAIGVLANALSSVVGREINRRGDLSPVVVTAVSMGIGASVLLVGGTVLQGFPTLSLTNWLIILWLAVVNTAFAFTLWNRTLRTLSAFQSSIVNNTMMIQIAILAWLFLGETITTQEGVGMVLALAGILIVQVRGIRREKVAG